MALETGTYISDLVATNPLGSDLKSQGDDHIRLIKAVLKATFPNIDGEVTPTPSVLNYTGLRASDSAGYTSSDTLSASDVGKHHRYASASAGTLTLPSASGLTAGSIIAFSNYGAGTLTVAADGSDLINALNLVGASSIKLQRGDGILLSATGSGWAQVVANNGVGMGQTWLPVTGSRAASTTYTNSTGKPIMVNVALTSSTLSAINVTIDSVVIVGSASTASGGRNHACFVVPPGSTYSVVNSAGTSAVANWAELRIG